MSSRKKSRRPSFKGSLNPSKRHRDRVNVELDNLAKLLPFPPEVISKLDKLSVLRLSASYLRTKSFFKGMKSTDPVSSTAALTLDDIEKNGKLRDMMLEALDGFLMVITQEGELFYASETISDFLGVSQASVIHQDFLRLVHVDDHKTLLNNLKLVPSPPEKKIIEIPDGKEKAAENDADETSGEGSEVGRERSFVCRLKCILNTNAGFYKPFQCHGRLRELDQPDVDVPQLALFLMCSPVEVSTSILEVRMKSMLFSTKNKLDLSFVDIDQKGKQVVGYTKKDIAAQSSYCMMHYDDIPILKQMHQDLISTGKCEGTFRWLNKQTKWQWLTGSGQVILKNNQPDFVITTNKPLTDEEGDDELRRRERDHGMVPTSPATMLTHLQIAAPPSPASTASFGESIVTDKTQSLLTTALSASPGDCPSISTTSCASAGLSPDDLPWDFDADTLFEASGTSWDSAHASLADLDGIGKADLVGDLYQLDVNDFNFDEDVGRTEPLNHSSGTSCAVQDFPPTFTQPVNHTTAPAWPPSQQFPVSVSSPNQQQFAAFAATGFAPPVTTASLVTSGMSAVNHQQNGITPMSTTSGYLNHVGMMNSPNTMRATSSLHHQAPGIHQAPVCQEPFAPGPMPALGQSSLLRVHSDKPLTHPPIKTESGQNSTGYYCSAARADPLSDMSRMAASGVSFYGHSAHVNANNRYQSRYGNPGNFSSWAPAPPSPYSSGSSSSTSSYTDALNVQFSPTELLTSPFASPRDDNEYLHSNVPTVAGPSPAGQYYPPVVNSNYRTVHRPRVANSFAPPFVNIPEISPLGMVEELVPSAHHVSPIAAHNAGLANW